MKRILVDTGPLVAIISAEDEYHSACVNALRGMPDPLWTCWPVITEAAWLLRRSPPAVPQLLPHLNGGFLELFPISRAAAEPFPTFFKGSYDIYPPPSRLSL